MKPSSKFLELVKTLAETQLECNFLKAILIAQWALESGWGNSVLFLQHNNAGGLKYRDKLPCDKISYTAHDGKTDYCKCSSLKNFIETYFAFINRSVYDGWKNSPTPEHFIKFIAKCGYCPTEGYADQVLALVPEAEKLLTQARAKPLPENKLTIKIFNLVDDVGVAVYYGTRAIIAQRTSNAKAMLETLSAYPNALVYCAKKEDLWPGAAVSNPPPVNPPPTSPIPPVLTNRNIHVLLNNGHKSHGNGAQSTNHLVDEFDLNLFQAKRIQGALNKVGINCDIVNQVQTGGLYETGVKAHGYDLFVCLHHNATVGAQGTCFLLGDKVKSASKEFGALLSKRISNVLNIKDRGYESRVVSVMKGADSTTCPCAVLVESYFIDSIPDMATAYDMSGRAADVISSAIIERFQNAK